jgi:polyisoprenoid-binding protein YceI
MLAEFPSGAAARWLGGVLLAGLLSTGPTPSSAAPARYVIDPEHLSVGFLVDHIGYAKVLGMFRKAEGSFTFDEEAGRLSDLRVEVTTESVFTNDKKRDEHLRSPDFLNSGEFPKMTFTAREARRTGDRTFEIAGELTLLGKAAPLTLTATWNKSGNYPFGGNPYVTGVSARGSFTRSAYGMTYAVANGWVGDAVELIIELEARRQ